MAFLFAPLATNKHSVLVSTKAYHEMCWYTTSRPACGSVHRKRSGAKNWAQRIMAFSRFNDGVYEHRVFRSCKHAHGPPSTAKLVGLAAVVRIFTMATRKLTLEFSASDAIFAGKKVARTFSFAHVDSSASLSSGYGLILWMR